MRTLLITLSLLLLVSPLVYSQQQYTEGACIMLQQQIDRFSHQKQNSNYRSAKREYDRFCRQPTTMMQREMRASDYSAVAKPAPATQPTVSQSNANQNSASQVSAPQADNVQTPAPQTAVAETSVELTNAGELAETKSAPIAEVTPVLAPTETAAVSEQPETIEVVSAAADTVTLTPETTITEVSTMPPAAAATDTTSQSDNVMMYDDLLMQILSNMPLIAANIFAALLAIFLLTSWFGFNLPGFKGVFAEYKLNRLLRWRLSDQYQHFRKLKLLTAKDELIVVDHLVLSPFGIFVIAVKSDRGRISGSEAQANWTRQYFGKSKHLMNPLHQNFKNVEAVKQLLQLKGSEATPILHSVAAFSRVAQFETAMPANVTYVDAVAAYLKQFTEPCLKDEQLQRFSALLSQASTER